MPLFYKNALTDWTNFVQLMYKRHLIMSFRIFGSHLVTWRRKPIFFSSFTRSNITSVEDIWNADNSSFINDDQVFRKMTNKSNWISEWSIVKNAVRAMVSNPLSLKLENGYVILDLSNLYFYTKSRKRMHYCDLKLKDILEIYKIKENRLPCEVKWENTVVCPINWSKIWTAIPKSFASLKAKQFQFKSIHRILFCEHKLNLCGLSNGICKVCGSEQETLKHLFWQCDHAQSFWRDIVPILETISVNIFKYDLPNPEFLVYFGFQGPIKFRVLNTLVFETKWQIWKSRNLIKHESTYIDIKLSLMHIRNTFLEQIKHSSEKKLVGKLEDLFVI